ncbi:MAG TPA: EAL domain-containing protein [Candidatus Binatia bacterium]|nr:EAL domain-containing protein [Candidatus Binatia bacterium]
MSSRAPATSTGRKPRPALPRHQPRPESASGTTEADLRRLFFENPQPMWIIDAESQHFLAVNDTAVQKYGYTTEEFAAMPATVIRPDSRWVADFDLARTRSSAFSPRHHRLKDGRWIDVEVSSVPFEFNGRPAFLSIINDVTERNRLETELREGVLRDPLTGGPNRALFVERVGHALTRMRRRSAAIAVLFIDVDHFKAVNDSLGYTAGDGLLQAVAARLATALRPGDTVARLSADEFAVLLEEVGEERRALEVAERLREAFDAPLDFSAGRVAVGLSIGVAWTANPRTQAEAMLRDAELAMHSAKTAGRGRVEVFTPDMHASARQRLEVEQDLRRAIELGQLRLHFQPLISMADGAIVGCEALVRWWHPGRGLIAPDNFIPVAEETGLIGGIDTWVMRTACAQVAAWRRSGLGDLFVAVNVSGRELGSGDLVDRVEAALWESELPGNRLEVEVTETTAVTQPAEALEELRHLRRAGIGVAVDDFGTGYSSLSKLATFPIDRLKIDRSFLTSVRREEDDAPLVAAMIDLGHRLGLGVTAEGVETPEQLAFLRRSGCDLLQGFLFSPPVPPDGFEQLLKRSPT